MSDADCLRMEIGSLMWQPPRGRKSLHPTLQLAWLRRLWILYTTNRQLFSAVVFRYYHNFSESVAFTPRFAKNPRFLDFRFLADIFRIYKRFSRKSGKLLMIAIKSKV